MPEHDREGPDRGEISDRGGFRAAASARPRRGIGWLARRVLILLAIVVGGLAAFRLGARLLLVGAQSLTASSATETGERQPDRSGAFPERSGSAGDSLDAVSPASETGSVEARPSSVAAALRQRRFDELEVLFERLVRVEADDPANGEIAAYLAFQAFDSADPELEEIAVEWMKRRPGSPFPRLLRAEHWNARAWAARGHRYAGDTPRSAFVEMEAWQRKARPEAEEAVRLRPDLVNGWTVLIGLAQGEPSQCVEIARRAVDHLPLSYRIRAALSNCLRPRWGGSYEAMEAIAREARTGIPRNPNLRALEGEVAEDRADLALRRDELEWARQWLDDAFVRGGRHWHFLRTEAWFHRKQEQWSESLASIDEGLERWPEHHDLLEPRIRALNALGRRAEAEATLDLLAAIDPVDPSVANWRRHFTRGLLRQCEQLARGKLLRQAEEACEGAVESFPESDEAHFWLGRVYVLSERHEPAQAEFETALRLEPRHREAIVNLDWLHGRRGEWETVLELWNDYLELEPSDARAYLERAGTNQKLNRRKDACRDLERSCELGNDKACGYHRGSCRGI